jgi:hypothetical protein
MFVMNSTERIREQREKINNSYFCLQCMKKTQNEQNTRIEQKRNVVLMRCHKKIKTEYLTWRLHNQLIYIKQSNVNKNKLKLGLGGRLRASRLPTYLKFVPTRINHISAGEKCGKAALLLGRTHERALEKHCCGTANTNVLG